jgi:hypothetical protein
MSLGLQLDVAPQVSLTAKGFQGQDLLRSTFDLLKD